MTKQMGNELEDLVARANNSDNYKSHLESYSNAIERLSSIEVGNALREIIARLSEYKILEQPSCEEVYRLKDLPTFEVFEQPSFSYFPDEPDDDYIENSEKHLKKLIKYAKTPMERKAYEKQLNTLYKKRKRNEKSDRTTRQGNQES